MRVPPPGPAAARLAARLARVESRNVTSLGPDHPIFWEEARGGNVQDSDGNIYLDLTGAFGVAAAGHAHPRIVEAVRGQAGSLLHGMGDVHPPARKVEFLERLAAHAPWGPSGTRTILAGSGSEAVEAALKTALMATDRPGIVAFEGGYHGLTLGSLATTSRAHFRAPFEARLFPGVAFVPFPHDPGHREVAVGWEGASELERFEEALIRLEKAGHPVGAVLVEPVQGRAGVRVPPPGFLTEVARRARQAGALLILDEIFTGFGRTGTLFAFEAEGLVPDLLCVGKALGGGLPIGACLGPAEVMDAWPVSSGEAIHTSTFLGNPLVCSAALAFLEVLEDEGLVDEGRRVGEALRTGLEEELEGIPGVRGIRGRGAFLGIVLEEEGWPAGGGAPLAMMEALRAGLLVLPAGARGEVVELSPPLNLTGEQVTAGVEGLAGVFKRIGDRWGTPTGRNM